MATRERQVMILTEFLSSSSSDDETDETIIMTSQREKKTKMMNFLEIVHDSSDEEFRQHFRLQRNTVYKIIERYEASPFYPSDRSHGGSELMSAEHDFLTFLWFAGNKVALRDVAHRFGVAISTTFNQINRIMDYLLHIAPNVISMPEDKEQAAAGFYNIAHFPDTISCIDGTSIKIRTPSNKIKSTYVNRHDIPSVTLQGICDSKKRFIDTSVGAPAKIHDARVYQLSHISSELRGICDKKYHVLGDSAYPIREWLLVPFRDYGNLSNEQKLYNKHFCSTRVLIENCFGLLKGRFRQLLELDMHKVIKICRFITSCCVVHNLCIEYNDGYIFRQTLENDEVREFNDDDDTEAHLKLLGEEKRNAVMRRLVDEYHG